ncbi:MAG: Fe-S-containing protein [Spirochaetaceae bacterium]|jgi:uncharacterized membrane protein|nr:Fe-S-containing protein [Spirochaetaceae bacterium]
MLRYLYQVVENLLTTGILTALLFAVIDKTDGAGRAKRFALWGCAAGAAAAFVLAVLRRTTALINRGFFNTWILSFAILFGIVFLFFLWKAPQNFTRKMPRKPLLALSISELVRPLLLAALLFYAMPVIFLYPAEFALPGESIFSTASLFKLIGFIAGLLVVILSSSALYQTAKVLSAKALKILISAALVLTMFNQAVVIAQFLLARRIIPMARWFFAFIIAAVDSDFIFFYLTMAIALCAPLMAFISGLKPPEGAKNPAERRKTLAALRSKRRWCAVVAVGFAVSTLSVTVVKDYTERGVELSPAEPMNIVGDEIIIPITQVEDGHLHRFVFTASDNTDVRFIVIKKNAVSYGVGLDACDICGPTGYYERKNEVICRLCDVVMNISTIGFKGGCNPVPLAYSLREGSIVIETINLENEKNRFK